MRSAAPVNINLLEFFKTGKFDRLELGQTKEWILQNFPDPGDGAYEYAVWTYGNIELHFDEDEKLFLIYSDHIDTLDGGESLQLNKWILDQPAQLTLEFVIHHLNKGRITYTIKHLLPGERIPKEGLLSSVVEIMPANVILGFAPVEKENESIDDYEIRCQTEDANQSMLVLFSLMSR